MTIEVIKRPYINIGQMKRVYLDELDLTHVDLDDLALALSHENRFGGHSTRPYSVLEHLLLVDWIYCQMCQDEACVPHPQVRLALLMHDAHEALVKDMPSPLKKALPDYRDLESRVELALHERFDIVRLMERAHDVIKFYDWTALNTERLAFKFELDAEDADWPTFQEYPAYPNFHRFELGYTTPANGMDRLRFMRYFWARLVGQLLKGEM